MVIKNVIYIKRHDIYINTFFLLALIIFIITGAIIQFLFTKQELVLALNKFAGHKPDMVFKIVTHAGSGVLFILPVIYFLLRRFWIAIGCTITLLFTGVFVYILKQLFFKGMPRPTVLIDASQFTHIIDNYKYHSYNTFPSGHTLSAFAFFGFLALLTKSRVLGILLFICAFSVGLSRVYLLQHFFTDVYAGAILGFISAVLGYYIAVKISKKYPALDKGLLNPGCK